MTGSSLKCGSPLASRQRPARPGAGLAVLTALVQTLGTTSAAHGQPARLDVLGYVLLAGGGLLLADRHRWPVAIAVVTASTTLAYAVLDYPNGPTFLAPIVATAAALKAGRHRPTTAIAVVTYSAWVILVRPTLGHALVVVAGLIGAAMLIEFAIRAAPVVRSTLEEQHRLSEERKRRQASEERLRIAQELHDVLGHHLSLINVRAGVGLHLMDRQPEQARIALDTIKDASAEALREVQSVLNALYPTGQAAPRTPAPGLGRLGELTADAGMSVRTTIRGVPGPLPPEVDRAGYRIVQEALTNVRRHAGAGAAASITLEYQPGVLVVQIDDGGGTRAPLTEPAADGNGISGMRERAGALGGTLTAAPLDGGWRVRARFPLPAPVADPAR